VKVVYDNRYKTVYSSDPASAPGRIESIYEKLQDNFEFVEPKPAKEEDILLVHSQHHIDLVKAHPLVYETALLAAGGAIKASEIAMQGEPAFGLIRPPGHHASRDSSWGFCYFNNIAVAIGKLRIETRIKKAVIIDIDLHYGDGTANIFASSPNVTYFHPEGTSRQAYMDNLSKLLQGYQESYDILAISAGFDRHELEKVSKRIGKANMGSSFSSCSIMEHAPVVIIVWNAGTRGWETETHSVAAAIQNMLLKAYALGLGTVWIGDIFYTTNAIKKHLGKPWKLTAAIALGWPAHTPEPRPRKTVNEVAEFLN